MLVVQQQPPAMENVPNIPPFTADNGFSLFTVVCERKHDKSLRLSIADHSNNRVKAVMVTKVNPDSPLNGKVKAQDLLVAVNGTLISDKQALIALLNSDIAEICFVVARMQEGESGRVPRVYADSHNYETLQVSIQHEDNMPFGLEVVAFDGKVLVSSVCPGSAVEDKLQLYDEIISISGQPPETPINVCNQVKLSGNLIPFVINRPVFGSNVYRTWKGVVENANKRAYKESDYFIDRNQYKMGKDQAEISPQSGEEKSCISNALDGNQLFMMQPQMACEAWLSSEPTARQPVHMPSPSQMTPEPLMLLSHESRQEQQFNALPTDDETLPSNVHTYMEEVMTENQHKQKQRATQSPKSIMREGKHHGRRTVSHAEKPPEIVEISFSDSVDPNKPLRKVPKRA